MDRTISIPEFESFLSNQAHLVVFPHAIVAVSKVSTAEGLADSLTNVGVGALEAALGPVGLLMRAAAAASDLQNTELEKPDLVPVDLNELLSRDQPTLVLHGQVPLKVLQTRGWPRTEWFRPLVVFPRSTILSVRVKWTSSVRLRIKSQTEEFRTEVHFWSVPRLRRLLATWGYIVV